MELEDAHLPLRPMRLLLVADSLDVGGTEWHAIVGRELDDSLSETGR